MSQESRKQLDCPSATGSEEGARIFGVVTGTPEAPRIGYLTEALPVTEKVLALAGSAEPTQVFRVAARCETSACKHWQDTGCSLAQRIVEGLRPVVNALPPCQIRSTCRWFRQEGREACVRCPQIMRDKPNATEHEKHVAGDE